jgi:hypothetical protein
MNNAQRIIGTEKGYINRAVENNWMTNHKPPRPRTTAEIMFRHITNNNDFIECHTALSDALIEVAILARCYAKKKKIMYYGQSSLEKAKGGVCA